MCLSSGVVWKKFAQSQNGIVIESLFVCFSFISVAKLFPFSPQTNLILCDKCFARFDNDGKLLGWSEFELPFFSEVWPDQGLSREFFYIFREKSLNLLH